MLVRGHGAQRCSKEGADLAEYPFVGKSEFLLRSILLTRSHLSHRALIGKPTVIMFGLQPLADWLTQLETQSRTLRRTGQPLG